MNKFKFTCNWVQFLKFIHVFYDLYYKSITYVIKKENGRTSESQKKRKNTKTKKKKKKDRMNPEYDYLFKLLLIGDSGVGKSCLLLRFAV